VYKIKPLEWKVVEHDYPDVEELYESITPICIFKIESYADREGNIWWGYHYCFDEYHDDGGDECLNFQDGKNICEKIWTDRLKDCLIEV
jgi:hypothetical protein